MVLLYCSKKVFFYLTKWFRIMANDTFEERKISDAGAR